MTKQRITVQEQARMREAEENPSLVDQMKNSAYDIAIKQMRGTTIYPERNPQGLEASKPTNITQVDVNQIIDIITMTNGLTKPENRQKVAQLIIDLDNDIDKLSEHEKTGNELGEELKLRIKQKGSISKAIGQWSKAKSKDTDKTIQMILNEKHE